VIRYRTGDRVHVAETPSPDGRTFRRLEGGVIGRVDDAMTVRGINVFPSAIENVVRRFPEVGEFAVDVFRRDELDELELKVEVSGEEPEDVVEALTAEIRNSIGIRATVAAVPHGSLPRFDLKARRFTDHRKRA
jgi:phenylacetate-CoA ligase